MPELPVWGMVLTPFTPELSVDHASLAAHVRSLLEQGVHGVVALAVIAEPGALTRDERAAVLDTVLDSARGRPVVATVMALDDERHRDELRTLIRPRADRLAAVMLPIHSPDPALVAQRLQAAHDECGLPVWVQDYPGPTGVSIAYDDLVDALRAAPAVVAVKCEAPPTFRRIHGLARALPHLQLLSGLGGANLVEDLVAGASAVACGISRPSDLVAATRAWTSGGMPAALPEVARFSARVGVETQPGTSIAIRKEHWRRAGTIACAAVRAPQLPYPGFLSGLSDALVT
ncbi:dihydrodipicolinate synthase family protein [Nocardioides nitrophenolicus]|uniref:dihydrodipicolinate synthase family protein n=1 Tax=Nocardioides nitrophenolicus TaxID=60489 RepID=UPI00195F0A2D|nr:dihydrodipicolinate synthase family protein [Nocardioides nitrophenolicus]MBM7520046.1 4-hydroxy-tetrahydrodipicolinate synthase [Nocardioides nitrophenolicus]